MGTPEPLPVSRQRHRDLSRRETVADVVPVPALSSYAVFATAAAGKEMSTTMAVIIDHGMREMLVQQKDVFYYVTMMNENYAQPTLPAGVAPDVI